jgi:monooxygenase
MPNAGLQFAAMSVAFASMADADPKIGKDAQNPPVPYVDVLIVGAGLSGIGAAVHLNMNCPQKSYAIVEGRDAIGGTWDLFRYPGIRSDSDMHTLGYRFKPWKERKAIADAPSILNYVRETADEHGITPKIRFNTKVIAADWDSATALWTVQLASSDGGASVQTCRFLYMCAGYYSYETGHNPELAGEANFAGPIIHAQFWPKDLDYAGKRVVVVGSGATAVTIVPEMAKTAAHVTMLQRSPTWIVARPSEDGFAIALRKIFPHKFAYFITRWKNILMGMTFFQIARKKPQWLKTMFLKEARQHLGPDRDLKDFTPSYNPWDQRVCLVPDADLFTAIRDGRADVVTGRIHAMLPDAVQLEGGKSIPADILVKATGLQLQVAGAAAISVDGLPVDFSKAYNHKGVMFSHVPNFAITFGYTNASWTLKADLTSEYICRLINHLDKIGADSATPTPEADKILEPEPMLDFSSGYVQRALHYLPKQGSRAPWKLRQNYAIDLITLRHKAVDDGSLVFGKAKVAKGQAIPTDATTV